MQSRSEIVVAIPCLDEERTVGTVVRAFRAQLPDARIVVIDNGSTDGTARVAEEAGATVLRESRRGKGFAIRAMLDRIEADFLVMVDGDDTYPAEAVHALLEPARRGVADMVVGARLAAPEEGSFRPLHVAGNRLIRTLINTIFRTNLTDILSGYRVFARRAQDYVPVVSSGFEIETELTAQVLGLGLTIVEVPVAYRARPEGSTSKLDTFGDGFRVLWKIFTLVRDFKPLTFFGALALVFALLSGLAGIPPILDYARERYVYHVPLAVLASGLGLVSGGTLLLGVLLHVLSTRFRELHSVLVRRGSRDR